MCHECEATQEGQRLRIALDALADDAHRQQDAADAARRAYLDHHDRFVLDRIADAPGPFFVHLDPREERP